MPRNVCDCSSVEAKGNCTAVIVSLNLFLCSEHFSFRESRYLLLLTENYGGLTILSENLLAGRHVVRIFGSSFPKDQEYTQVGKYVV